MPVSSLQNTPGLMEAVQNDVAASGGFNDDGGAMQVNKSANEDQDATLQETQDTSQDVQESADEEGAQATSEAEATPDDDQSSAASEDEGTGADERTTSEDTVALPDGTQVPLADVERWRSDSENREAWQRENTRKSQELAALRADVEKGQRKPDESPGQTQDDASADFADLDDDDPSTSAIRSLAKQVKDLRFEKEIAEIRASVQQQMGEAQTKYPEMHRASVIAELMATPDADLMQLAKQSHEAMVASHKAWMARQGKKQKQAPKVSGGGKASARSTTSAKGQTKGEPDASLSGRGMTTLVRQVTADLANA